MLLALFFPCCTPPPSTRSSLYFSFIYSFIFFILHVLPSIYLPFCVQLHRRRFRRRPSTMVLRPSVPVRIAMPLWYARWSLCKHTFAAVLMSYRVFPPYMLVYVLRALVWVCIWIFYVEDLLSNFASFFYGNVQPIRSCGFFYSDVRVAIAIWMRCRLACLYATIDNGFEYVVIDSPTSLLLIARIDVL